MNHFITKILIGSLALLIVLPTFSFAKIDDKNQTSLTTTSNSSAQVITSKDLYQYKSGTIIVKYKENIIPDTQKQFTSLKTKTAYNFRGITREKLVKSNNLPKNNNSGVNRIYKYKIPDLQAKSSYFIKKVKAEVSKNPFKKDVKVKTNDFGNIEVDIKEANQEKTIDPYTQEILDQLNADPNVEYAQISQEYFISNVDPIDDTHYNIMWGLENTGQELPMGGSYTDTGTVDADIDAESAWQMDTSNGGEGVVVAVIDTGVDYNHQDLGACTLTEINDGDPLTCPKFVPGYDFINNDNDPMDDNGHGTHCTGTIAALDNDLGIIGVAPNAKIMPVKVFSSSGSAWDTDIIPAITWAVDNGADILSNSWGGPDSSNQALIDVFQYAYDNGVFSVVAAGNDYSKIQYYTPANYKTVITVGATDYNDQRAGFSNTGPELDIVAPGVGILSLKASAMTDEYYIYDNDYAIFQGTSMATPHVAGAVAMILANHPEYTIEQVRQVLRSSADDLGNPGFDTEYGYGRVNLANALNTFEPILTPNIISPDYHTTVKADFTLTYKVNETADSWGVYYIDNENLSEKVLATSSPNCGASDSDGLITCSVRVDANNLSDGELNIILKTFNGSGQVFSDNTSVIVNNFEITNIQNNDIYRLGDKIAIMGITKDDNYTIEWSIHGMNEWSLENVYKSYINMRFYDRSEIKLATWDTSTLMNAYYDIRFVTNGEEKEKVLGIYLDNTLKTGFPVHMEAQYFDDMSMNYDLAAVVDQNNQIRAFLPGEYTNTSEIKIKSEDNQEYKIIKQDQLETAASYYWPGYSFPVVADILNGCQSIGGVEGDLNKDGKIDKLDVSIMQKMVSNEEKFSPCADFNNSGNVEPTDLSELNDLISDNYNPTELQNNNFYTQSNPNVCEFRYGDVNGDNLANYQDFDLTKAMITGTLPYHVCADLDQDGVIAPPDFSRMYDATNGRCNFFTQEPCTGEGNNDYLMRDENKEIVIAKGGRPVELDIYNSNGYLAKTIKITGSDAPGGNISFPVVADIDNDNENEILIYLPYNYNEGGKLHAYNPDGSIVNGYPITLGYNPFANITVADLDNDNENEIIVYQNGAENNTVTIIKNNQIIKTIPIAPHNWLNFNWMYSAPAVGNFDDDLDLEIVIAGPTIYSENEPMGFINIFNIDGSVVEGWPIQTPEPTFIAPVIGDIDNNQTNNIIIPFERMSTDGGGLFVYENNGTILPNWPMIDGYYDIDVTPALADVNNDGFLEIAFSKWNTNYLLDHNGQNLFGWPIVSNNFTHAQYATIIEDVNNDNKLDIITCNGKYFGFSGQLQHEIQAYDYNGNVISNFPKLVEGYWDIASPTIADLDNDGKKELIAVSNYDYDWHTGTEKFRGSLYVYNLNSSTDTETNSWPTYMHDFDRTGNYNLSGLNLPAPISGPATPGITFGPIIQASTGLSSHYTPNISSQYNPAIFGSNIVWEDSRARNRDIFLYNLSNQAETQITYNLSNQSRPTISANHIIWQDEGDGIYANLYNYNISTQSTVQLPTTFANQRWQGSPDIDNNKIVWQQVDTKSEIWLYDLDAGIDYKISANMSGVMNPKVSGNYVVFQDNENIFLLNLSNQMATRLYTNISGLWNPNIDGMTVTWNSYENNQNTIYAYNISSQQTKKVVSSNSLLQGSYIQDNKIVWYDWRTGDAEVYMYDLNTDKEYRITNNKYNQINPVIYGNTISWMDDRMGEWNIYYTTFSID